MKSKVYASSLAKSIGLGLCAIAFSLSVVSQSQAKTPGNSDVSLIRSTNVAVSINDRQTLKTINAGQLADRLARMIARHAKVDPKSVKVLVKDCGCAVAAPNALYSFSTCMKGCLADAGVSPYSLIICGAACGTGSVVICAICVGASIAVIEVCALGCALYPGPYRPGPGGIQGRGINRRHPTSGSSQAKLRLQPATGMS